MLYAVDDELANLLRRGPTELAVTSEDPAFPAEGLIDRKPWEIFSADSAGPDVAISKEVELLTNAGFETWAGGMPDGWGLVGEAEAVFQEETVKHGGTYALKLGEIPVE